MGLFDFGKKKTGVHLDEDARCCRCRKRIRRGEKYYVLHGELYCEKCGRRKKTDDEIAFAIMMEDD